MNTVWVLTREKCLEWATEIYGPAPWKETQGMRLEALRVIKLLSALESWSFSMDKPLPDFLIEELNRVVDELSEDVLK